MWLYVGLRGIIDRTNQYEGEHMNQLSSEQQKLYDALTTLQKKCVVAKLDKNATSNAVAYCSATGRHNLSATHASRLAFSVFSHPNVKAFLKSMEKETIDDMIMGRDELLSELTDIASTTIDDIVQIVHSSDNMMNVETGAIYTGLESITIKRLEEIPEHARKSIKSIKQGRYGLEVTLHDSLTARKMIADMQGFNAPTKTEIKVDGPTKLDDFYGDTES
ncbi:putative small subunit terminase [Vibrio phage Rostov M3]|uniref:Putative small subunit terminase n=1 Tax=Vibrio phage Rostov M3 TaxID=2660724 RepID=A0A5Q2WEA4_9CAUD|nr:putative small subunit terminase [Vibrio phage Rostov M3]